MESSMNTYEEWQVMTEEQRQAWRKGHAAGYGFGLYGTLKINPYYEDDPLYSVWEQGARQGYQDS
jgi:hypothetical protein